MVQNSTVTLSGGASANYTVHSPIAVSLVASMLDLGLAGWHTIELQVMLI